MRRRVGYTRIAVIILTSKILTKASKDTFDKSFWLTGRTAKGINISRCRYTDELRRPKKSIKKKTNIK